MRVTVQIDDDRGGSDAAAPEAGQPAAEPLAGSTQSAGAPIGTAAGPSAELAARAARLGAISAGPAPSGPPGGGGAPGFLVEGLGTPAAGTPGAPLDAPADHSAGPAPTDQLEGT
jgi:hypothetical protein